MQEKTTPSPVIAALEGLDIGLDLDSVKPCGEGDFFAAYAAEDRWIFRFAKNAEAHRTLLLERAVVPQIARRVELAVPSFQHHGVAVDSGLGFVGYPRIDGERLTMRALEALPERAREDAASTMATFLSQLHAIDPEEIPASLDACVYPFARTEHGVREGSARLCYGEDLERLARHDHASPALIGVFERVCQALIDDAVAERRPPVIVHGDLGPDHILHDPVSGQITGVIDFSDVILTDRALDVAYLHGVYGEMMTAALISPSERVEIERLNFWHIGLKLEWSLSNAWREGIEYWTGALERLAQLVDPLR